MFKGFTPETIDFLWGIRFNNNRDWFQAHKAEYERTLYRPMLDLAEEVRQRVHIPDTIVKPSRIYRDVRYSGGIPYKDHLWFCLREDREFWSGHPSMYFQIEPEGGSLGFLCYSPKAQLMAAHRRRMQARPGEFPALMEKLLSSDRFQDQSTRYTRPKEGGEDLPETWYQLKNCFLCEEVPVGEQLYAPELAERIISAFEILEPLYGYFRKLEAGIGEAEQATS